MSEFVFTNLITIMKRYAKNPKEAYQTFISSFFKELSDENEKYLYLPSNKSSRIMTRQYDLPKDLKEIVKRKSYEKLAKNLDNFFKLKIDAKRLVFFFRELKEVVQKSDNIPQEIKKGFGDKNTIKKSFIDLTKFVFTIDNRIKINEVIWSKGRRKIVFINGDILALAFNSKEKQKEKIVVIPFDTGYHLLVTKVSNKYQEVSRETIHGKWIQRMLALGVSINDIKKCIEKNIIHPNQIGSIVKIAKDDVLFYLIGFSQFDENNRAFSSVENLKICISNILDEYDKNGQGVPLYMPLLGTGMSRTKLSYEESKNIIIEECLKNTEKIQGIVNIVAFTNNMRDE